MPSTIAPALWTGMFHPLGLPLKTTIAELSQAGFAVAELCGPYLMALSQEADCEDCACDLRSHCDSLGFWLTQAHGPALSFASPDAEARVQACQEVERLLPILHILGIRTLVFHADNQAEPHRDSWTKCWQNCLGRNADAFRRLVGQATDFGIRIAVENVIDGKGPGRRVFGAHPMDLEALLEQVPGLGLNLDTAHARAMNLDIPALIHQFGERLYGLHISDSTGVFHDLHLTPGKGDLDWVAIICALCDVGYDGDFHMELPHERADGLTETRAAAREAYEVCQRLLVE